MAGYCALFITEAIKSKETIKLTKDVWNKHVTYSFGVTKEEAEEIMPLGTKVIITITGYACDGNNSGFRVAAPQGYECSKNSMNGVVPHITTSLSMTGKAVDTAHLNFNDCTTFTVEGTFGYYDFDTKEVVYNNKVSGIIKTLKEILTDYCCNEPIITLKKEMDNILILSISEGNSSTEAWISKNNPDFSDENMNRIALRLCGIC